MLAALAMGAPLIIAVARNPARLERVRAIDPKRIATVALGRGESITNTVKELTNGQGASVLAELAPGGIETTIECIRNLEPGGRVALIAPNPEPLNLPLRYLMIRSIEFTSVTGRFAMDVAELLQLVHRGVRADGAQHRRWQDTSLVDGAARDLGARSGARPPASAFSRAGARRRW